VSRDSVLVIHEVGEPGHYAGLMEALGPSCKVDFIEFSTGLLLYRRVRKRSLSLVIKAVKDFLRLATYALFPSLLRDRLVVVGIAPLDWRVGIISRVLKHASVIYHTSWTVWDGSFFPRGSGTSMQRACWRKFLEQVPAIAAVTPVARDSLLENWSVSASALVGVVYHSYDKSVFNVLSRNSSQRDSLRQLRLIFAGRLVPEKGIESLLRIATSCPWVQLSIVGDGPLKSLVSTASTNCDNIFYHGYVLDRSELAELYRASDVVVQPSVRTGQWEELFGMALVEAMACGCVPLASAHAGPLLIIDDPEMSGFCLVDESKFEAAALAILESLRADSERLLDLSRRSVRIAERYERGNIAISWLELVSHLRHSVEKGRSFDGC